MALGGALQETGASCQTSEPGLPEYGRVWTVRPAGECSACEKPGGRAAGGGGVSRTALITAEWLSRMGQSLMLFTKWT